MTLVFGDRIKETSTTTGTGTYTLAGAVTGFQSFAAIGNANTCYYTATDGINWEVGTGTYTSSGTTLARTSVLASSNAGSAVNWSAGTKTIWNDFPKTYVDLLVLTTRTLTAAGLVTGGGTLAADRTFTVTAATQSDQETGSSTAVAVVPGVQQFHPSAAKHWGYVTVAAGTPTLVASYNITSITDTAAGILDVAIGQDYSSANWSLVFSVNSASGIATYNTKNAGTHNIISLTSGGATVDPAAYDFHGFGDQ